MILKVHYAELPEDQKPGWLSYELFGGGREVRVVARREKERRRKKKPVVQQTEKKEEEKKKEELEYFDYPTYIQTLTG